MLFHFSHAISTDDYPVPIMPSHKTVQWELERTIRSASWGRGPRVVVMLVDQSCPTLCNPMDCSPPGSSVHEISQARILELPFPSGDLPGPGTEPASPVSPTLQTDSLPLSHWGSPRMQLGFPKEHRTFKCYICSDIKLTSLHLPISFHRTE